MGGQEIKQRGNGMRRGFKCTGEKPDALVLSAGHRLQGTNVMPRQTSTQGNSCLVVPIQTQVSLTLSTAAPYTPCFQAVLDC
jgi:hypothetical protein